MRLLLIINYNHKVSKQFVKFLKFKKISFDYIDSSKKKKIKISKNYDYLISFLNSMYINKSVRKKIKINSFNFHLAHLNIQVLDVIILLCLIR